MRGSILGYLGRRYLDKSIPDRTPVIPDVASSMPSIKDALLGETGELPGPFASS